MALDDKHHAEIAALETRAAEADRAGREHDAISLRGKILEIDPNHARTLSALGQYSFRNGNLAAARTAFQRVADTDGTDVRHWINLALVCQLQKDEAAEEAAITQALVTDPMDMLALVMRGNLMERRGNKHLAARAYGAAATVAPAVERLNPDLRPAIEHARAFRERYDREFGEFMDQFLAPHYKTFSGERLDRFSDSFDIMIGRKRRYDSFSQLHHYPGLPVIEFFDRARFPWLDAFEAATDEIREEFLAAQPNGRSEPYIAYSDDVPHNQWAALNNSADWSAFHLFKRGNLVAENANRCPKTMALLKTAPQPIQQERTPAAMFSCLKPKTHIPPHTGVSNVRLVTHVPLIVPPDCGFRVGNTTRGWEPGKAFVFDDTIEHEAWNESDQLRVVLIFDIWHPDLSEAERAMVGVLSDGMNAFSQGEGGFDL